MVLFFHLCNYAYEQVAGLAAQPAHLKEQRDALLRFHYKIQTSTYSGRIFAQIKRAKNIDSFEKK